MSDPAADQSEAAPEVVSEPENGDSAEASTLLLENDLLQRDLEAARRDLQRAVRESEQAKDLARRTRADLINIRRRAANERREHRSRALEEVCLSFLPVFDDLERAAASAGAAARTGEEGPGPEASLQALAAGVRLVLRRFRDTLATHGIEEIEAEGAAFDPRLHEALLRMPAAPGERDEQITRVFERGFRSGARVIRHAKVQVADGTAPPAEPEQGPAGKAGDEAPAPEADPSENDPGEPPPEA